MKKKALPLVTVTEHGVRFATGIPVRFEFIRNTEPAPKPRRGLPDQFQQRIDPAGRYMLHRWPGGIELPRGWESGTITFHHPLVLKLTLDPDRIYGPESWKALLSKHYRAKKLALSHALRRAGYDGIVTVTYDRAGNASTSEIVDLTAIA